MTKTLSGGRGWASDACADSVHRLDNAFGYTLPIASAGRTYQEQADAYYRYKYQGGALALPPGTSVHEQGNAIDWGNQVYGALGLWNGLGNQGLTINRNGHRRTVSSEVWHTEYFQNEDQFAGASGGGSSSQVVLDRQNFLNAYRNSNITADGISGPQTEQAIRDYQVFLRDNYGYTGPIDGDWGDGTQAAHQKYWDKVAGGASSGGWPANAAYGADWVKAIQDKLNRLGYGTLDVDGQDGPATQAAVSRFQTDNGLTADGVAGPITNNKLDEKLSPAVVGRNASGRSTYDLQQKLIAAGYDLGAYGADGDYGSATTAAVLKFQKDNGLTADGIYGPATDAKLFASAPVVTPAPTTWPSDGRNATTRPTADIQKLVGAEADGAYGPKTSQKVAEWQSKNGLDADGVWGPASDAKGFPGVALPDQPKDPAADPLYGKKLATYPGATWADVSPNKSVRTSTVKLFIIHHRADTGTPASARKRFMTANDRDVSPNWNINQDGSVDEIVPPDDYRAWTTGSIDHQAVTVETGNTSGEPNWGISQESHESIAQLVAWASKRYGFPIQQGAATGTGKNSTVTVPGVIAHRDTPVGKESGTVCPGPSMNMSWIMSRAKDIYVEKYTTQTPPPVVTPPVVVPPVVTPTPEAKIEVPRAWLENLMANQLDDAAEIKKYLG